jgi:MFS family permease
MSAAILSGAFGGLLAGAITGGLEGAHGLRGWRWLFIVEGVATVGWAGISSLILLDFPANSKRLTDRERDIAIARLSMDNVTVRDENHKIGKRVSFILAFKDWRTIGFILGYMVILSLFSFLLLLTFLAQVIVGSSTLSYFYPTLVNGLGFTSTVQAQYMTVRLPKFLK